MPLWLTALSWAALAVAGFFTAWPVNTWLIRAGIGSRWRFW